MTKDTLLAVLLLGRILYRYTGHKNRCSALYHERQSVDDFLAVFTVI